MSIRIEKQKVGGNPIYILHLEGTPNGDGTFKNQLNNEFLADFHLALDSVLEQTPKDSPQGAIVTVSKGKHYADGLDLAFVFGLQGNERMEFLKRVDVLFARLLTFPMITVAAVNGHAFAGGMLLALCHDYRVGNGSKGFWCMSEIDIPSRLTPGFSALLNAKLPANLASHMMTTGARLSSKEMVARGGEVVVQVGQGEDEVLKLAVELAAKYAEKGKPEMEDIKEDLWWDALRSMRGNEPFRVRAKPKL